MTLKGRTKRGTATKTPVKPSKVESKPEQPRRSTRVKTAESGKMGAQTSSSAVESDTESPFPEPSSSQPKVKKTYTRKGAGAAKPTTAAVGRKRKARVVKQEEEESDLEVTELEEDDDDDEEDEEEEEESKPKKGRIPSAGKKESSAAKSTPAKPSKKTPPLKRPRARGKAAEPSGEVAKAAESSEIIKQPTPSSKKEPSAVTKRKQAAKGEESEGPQPAKRIRAANKKKEEEAEAEKEEEEGEGEGIEKESTIKKGLARQKKEAVPASKRARGAQKNKSETAAAGRKSTRKGNAPKSKEQEVGDTSEPVIEEPEEGDEEGKEAGTMGEAASPPTQTQRSASAKESAAAAPPVPILGPTLQAEGLDISPVEKEGVRISVMTGEAWEEMLADPESIVADLQQNMGTAIEAIRAGVIEAKAEGVTAEMVLTEEDKGAAVPKMP